MKWLIDVGMRADTNDDHAVDHDECAALEDEMESHVCHEVVDHCGNQDGVMHGCDFFACVEEHAKHTHCIAHCPCDEDDESMYCMGLHHCHEGKDLFEKDKKKPKGDKPEKDLLEKDKKKPKGDKKEKELLEKKGGKGKKDHSGSDDDFDGEFDGEKKHHKHHEKDLKEKKKGDKKPKGEKELLEKGKKHKKHHSSGSDSGSDSDDEFDGEMKHHKKDGEMKDLKEKKKGDKKPKGEKELL